MSDRCVRQRKGTKQRRHTMQWSNEKQSRQQRQHMWRWRRSTQSNKQRCKWQQSRWSKQQVSGHTLGPACGSWQSAGPRPVQKSWWCACYANMPAEVCSWTTRDSAEASVDGGAREWTSRRWSWVEVALLQGALACKKMQRLVESNNKEEEEDNNDDKADELVLHPLQEVAASHVDTLWAMLQCSGQRKAWWTWFVMETVYIHKWNMDKEWQGHDQCVQSGSG